MPEYDETIRGKHLGKPSYNVPRQWCRSALCVRYSLFSSVQGRPFENLENFCTTATPRILNRKNLRMPCLYLRQKEVQVGHSAFFYPR